MTVREIETAIARLSPTELAEFAVWFDRYHERAWDEQIAKDVRSGRLDEAIGRAEEDYELRR